MNEDTKIAVIKTIVAYLAIVGLTGCTATKVSYKDGIFDAKRISILQKVDATVKVPEGPEVSYANDGGNQALATAINNLVKMGAAIK